MGRPPPLHDRIAVVDLSHGGTHSLEGWRDDAIDGVYLNLMRAKALERVQKNNVERTRSNLDQAQDHLNEIVA